MSSPLRTALVLSLASLAVSAQEWSSVKLTPEMAEQPFPIEWQRAFADAQALARETGRPLLLAVNVDGENACEVFALYKYRQPEFAELVEPFVAVIAGPERHNAEDFDALGRRIPCPRFGTVTCGEHVANEPAIFDLFGEGQRVAPRHIGVSPDGEKLFDRFLDQNLTRVDEALIAAAREVGPPATTQAPADGEPGLEQLVRSRDARDRERVEALFASMDRDSRVRALALAADAPSLPESLVRLGLASEEESVRLAAAEALASNAGPDDVDALIAALDRPDLAGAHAALLQSLEQLAGDHASARRAFHAREALAQPVDALADVAWEAAPGPAAGEAPTTEQLDALWQAVDAVPDDPAARIALARGLLATARAEMAGGGGSGFFAMDAENVAREALEAGASQAEAAAVLAQSQWLLGRTELAAEAAAQALPYLRANPGAADSALVLESLARGRTNAIYAAEVAEEDWPSRWLAEAIAAYDALAEHPGGTAAHAGTYADLLGYLNLTGRQGEVLDAALRQFPADEEIHRRFRDWTVAREDFAALEEAYAARAVAPEDEAAFRWFAGYASLLAAEDHRRGSRRDEAGASYGRAIASFEQSLELAAGYRDTVDHYVALCLAGRARLALQRQDLDGAEAGIRAALERRPASAETSDGLEQTPLETLDRVEGALRRADRVAEADALAEVRRELTAEETPAEDGSPSQ